MYNIYCWVSNLTIRGSFSPIHGILNLCEAKSGLSLRPGWDIVQIVVIPFLGLIKPMDRSYIRWVAFLEN
jgi:hypothetical protein